ncbi:serine/threonine-protein kinase prpf4B-like [Gouania willdenowi]|uniref:serine/threonine-protein kinase prpf4B-like n=1 Tax=Gouania willdenowi TaxID=441366 RepID=UPI001056355F|nr:serine/threonine-protein kinase prpf4B-like [Gouania willdenowi]
MSTFLCSDTSAAAAAERPVLRSSTADYSILERIGEGSFGKVLKCQNLKNNKTVAVKIIKDGFEDYFEHEISMLKIISVLDTDRTNLLTFYEHFMYVGYNCLAFELLEMDLYTLMKNREWESLSVKYIRPIAEQLLVALDALKGLGITHADIKPDNVMVVSGNIQELKVKLIDFGVAVKTSSMKPGLEIQPLGYRAPEVSIGLPVSEAIDVWALGCVLVYLYIGENLFSVLCEYQTMKRVSELLGLPKDDQLQAGAYTSCFFREAEEGSKWRLMTPEEYQAHNSISTEEEHYFVEFSTLDDLVNVQSGEESGEVEDREAFVDLLKQLLCLDGNERISPCQAQFHPFFSTSHLNQQETIRHHQPSLQADETSCHAPDEKSVLDDASASKSSDRDRLKLATAEADGLPPLTDLDLVSAPTPHLNEDVLDQSSDGVTGCFAAERPVLRSSTADYSILERIGEGSFGKVLKCQNLKNNKTVAVKIIKDGFEDYFEHEISMLKIISVLDTDRTNLLTFYEHFMYVGYNCLAFELLEMDLYTLMKNREWESLSVKYIRPIAEQLLVALDALKGLGITHADIKPDNVMVVSGNIQELKVKLIDFGVAVKTSSMKPGLEIQPLGYRAPEVSIGLPVSEAIDVWALGCVLVYLYIGENLFSVLCEYQTMKRVSELLGLPKDDQLQAGAYTSCFFREAEEGSKWRLMTPEEYQAHNSISTEEEHYFVEFSTLDDLVNVQSGEGSGEVEDREAFVDLLKQLLCLDGNERISPCQAQFHPFFSTSHLNQQETIRHHQPSLQADETSCHAPDEKSVLDDASASKSSDRDRLKLATAEADGLPPLTDLDLVSAPTPHLNEDVLDQSSDGVTGCFVLTHEVKGQEG